MNEKTRAVIDEAERLVDIYHGSEFIGTVFGNVTRITLQDDCLIVHVRRDGIRGGTIIAHAIQKGDQ